MSYTNTSSQHQYVDLTSALKTYYIGASRYDGASTISSWSNSNTTVNKNSRSYYTDTYVATNNLNQQAYYDISRKS